MTETYSRHLIRIARRRAGITQAELARRAGTSQPAVSAYESGRRSPSVDTLARILEAAGAELRMRLATPDSHGPALAAAESLLPHDQLVEHRARDEARVAQHRTRADLDGETVRIVDVATWEALKLASGRAKDLEHLDRVEEARRNG